MALFINSVTCVTCRAISVDCFFSSLLTEIKPFEISALFPVNRAFPQVGGDRSCVQPVWAALPALGASHTPTCLSGRGSERLHSSPLASLQFCPPGLGPTGKAGPLGLRRCHMLGVCWSSLPSMCVGSYVCVLTCISLAPEGSFGFVRLCVLYLGWVCNTQWSYLTDRGVYYICLLKWIFPPLPQSGHRRSFQKSGCNERNSLWHKWERAADGSSGPAGSGAIQ